MAGKCPEELEEQFIQDCSQLGVYELAEKYDRALTTVKEWRLDLYRKGRLLWWPGIRVPAEPPYSDWEEIDDDAVIISDLEIPFHDEEVLGYAVALAKKLGITTLVIAGDLLALDALTPFAVEDGVRNAGYTAADNKHEAGLILEDLGQQFQRIVVIKGNHEQRGSRQKEWGFIKSLARDWEELGDITVSYYKWCIVQGIQVEHPSSYSRVPGSLPRARAEIEDRPVLCAHTHNFSKTFTRSDTPQVDKGLLGHSQGIHDGVPCGLYRLEVLVTGDQDRKAPRLAWGLCLS